MNCPRCGGFLIEEAGYTDEQGEPLLLARCVNCGHRCGDSVLDQHHMMDCPPEPTPDVMLPIYDPQRRRLIAAIVKHLNNLD